MKRCSFCEWIPIWPWPVRPLAGQCSLGQNTVVGSMTLLLAMRGNIATRSMSGPPFALQRHRTTVWCRAILTSRVLKLGFLSPFGDITLWNILVSCVVLPYISPYSRMTNRMLWGHILSVAPQTSSMAGGARFHLDISHNRPDAFVT